MAPSKEPKLELPDWRQAIPDEDSLMKFIVGTSFKDQFDNVEVMKVIKTDLGVVYLPLILAHLEEAATVVEDVEHFKVTCEYVKSILCSSRPTKLRFLLLCKLGKHHKLWDLKLVYKSDAYGVRDRAIKSLETKLRERSQKAAVKSLDPKSLEALSKVTADELLKDDEKMDLWTSKVFFHPVNGIKPKSHVVGLRTIPDSFSEYEASLFIIEKVQVLTPAASKIGQRMVDLGLITRASSFPSKEFGRGKNYYQSNEHESAKSVSAGIVRDETGKKREEMFGLTDNNIGALKISTTVFVDEMDVQSLVFWRDAIWTHQLVEKSDYGWMQVVHPLKGISDLQLGDIDANSESAAVYESVHQGGIIGVRVHVDKVFSKSIAVPGIVSIQVVPEESVVEFETKQVVKKISGKKKDDPSGAKVLQDTPFKSLEPKVLVKEGDNLMQDSCVELMFRVFNYLWRTDKERFPDVNKVPFSYAYDVLPTGPVQGLMEVLTNVKPLNQYQWDDWAAEFGKNKEVLDLMTRSAAGSCVGAYVVGARDRHWDNIVIKDGCMMVQIDFGFVLGSEPPIDAPRFSISPDMERVFKEVGIWEDFVALCGKAFSTLKSQAPAVGREIYTLFRHTGLDFKKIMTYLAQPGSLNKDATLEEAEEHVIKQVRSSSHEWKTYLRAFAHDHVDPVYYKMLKAKMPLTMFAEMIVQQKQKKKMGNIAEDETEKSGKKGGGLKVIFGKKKKDEE